MLSIPPWRDGDERKCQPENFYSGLPSYRSPNIWPLISRWELHRLKNCQNKSFRTSEILTLLYQQFSHLLLIFQRDMRAPRLAAMSNNRWSWGTFALLLPVFLYPSPSENERRSCWLAGRFNMPPYLGSVYITPFSFFVNHALPCVHRLQMWRQK